MTLKRDASFESARQYRDFINGLHPCDYYFLLYNLGNIDTVARASITGIWQYVYGLLFMHQEGITVDGLSDQILRMVWERAARYLPLQETGDFYERQELIETVHRRAGKGVENALRT